MLLKKQSSTQYRAELITKLNNFLEKAPSLFSYFFTEDSIKLTHEKSQTSYTFDFDYDLSTKAFIYNIKQKIAENHYPRMVETKIVVESLSEKEIADLIIDGIDPKSIPETRKVVTETLWRIDRVIIRKDIFIIINEDTMEQFRYKMNKSCTYFLKDYRLGKFDLQQAWDYFIKNSVLLNKIEIVNSTSFDENL